VLPQVPAPPEVAVDAEARLRGDNAAAGVHVDAHTLRPDWDGTRLNLGYAISVMHPLAIQPSRRVGEP